MDYISLGCCLLAFLLYYNTLDAGFVYDDRRAILTNPDVLATSSWVSLLQNDFWGTPLKDNGSHGSYRPLCVMSFKLNHLLGGFQPWGYHLVNVLLHCLATGLVVRVARKVFPRNYIPVGPAVAGLLFATHPIHTEAVAGIVGRADLAACNFYLLSFLAYVAHVKYRDQKCIRIDFCSCCENHKRTIRKEGRGASRSWFLSVDVCFCSRGVAADGVKCLARGLKQWFSMLLCLVLAAAAVLSKETGITVLVVCALYDVTHKNFTGICKKQLRSLAILTVFLFAMLLLRLQITQGNTPEFSTADNPTARSNSILTRFLTFSYLPTFNFKLLLCPVTLSFDWSMDSIPRISSLFDTRNVISLLFYLMMYQAAKMSIKKVFYKQLIDRKPKKYKTKRRMNEHTQHCSCPVCHHSLSDHSLSCRTNNNNNTMNSFSTCICQPVYRTQPKISSSSSTILISLAFLILPFLPATNLFFYVGFVVAERILYLPSVGYCLLVGLGAGRLKKAKYHWKMGCVALIMLVIMFSLKTMKRNRDWFNEETLYRSAISVNPPKAYGNLGSVLSSQGRTAEAEWAYRKALEHRSNMADVHYNLGNLLQGKQKYDEAIESYQRAIHFRPSLALAYVNLGAALVAAGRCQEAVSILRQGSRLDGSGLKDRRTHETARVSALLQLGALYSDQGRLQRALAAYREALATMPHYYPPQSVYNLLGETLSRLQQFEEAERWYQMALQAQPDHVPAHITYGKLLAKNGSRIGEAEQWFRRAQRLAPSDPSVYHHYGEFLAGQGRHKEAAVQYVRAAELKPSDYELVVAAATALRQADRRNDAERWYKKAVSLRPLDPRSHTNLGAILHLNGKYSQAADSYREALRLQPDDVTTLTNLHKLYSVMS